MQFKKDKVQNYLHKYYKRRRLLNLSISIESESERYNFDFGFENPLILNGQLALYEIGSLTKLLIGSTYESLINRGQLCLQDSLYFLLRDKIEIAPQFRKITIESLLTHTSGLPRLPKEFLDAIEDVNDPYKGFTDQLLIEYIRLSDDSILNNRYVYSNLGYGILGLILTIKLEKDLYTILNEIILTPLMMTMTTTLPFAKPELLLEGHNFSNKVVPHWNMDVFQGAGFLISNTTDMMKYLHAHLETNNSLTFLKLAEHLDNRKRVAFAWHKYGMLSYILRFNKYIWHNGMTGGFSSYATVNPSRKTAIIALTNKSEDLTECILGLYSYLGNG